MARGAPWTDAEDAILGAAYREGRTDREIAGLLNQRARALTFAPRTHDLGAPGEPGEPGERSENAVRRRRQTLALVSEAWAIDRDRLRELHATGLSAEAMATELGGTRRTIQQLCWVMRLALSGRPPKS